MTANEGQGFINLVNHFVDSYKKSLTENTDMFQPLKNEVYDRIYMMDQSDDAAPLPKGIRAFQGMSLRAFILARAVADEGSCAIQRR